MKQSILITLMLILLTSIGFAQTDGMSYQAVIIDKNEQEIPGVDVVGNPLSEGEVVMRFSIIDEFGNPEYQETQETKTDSFGMISLIIGQGERTGESLIEFSEIDWNATPRQLKVEISYEDSEFEAFSEKELFFIPYAWHRNITATGTLDVDGATTLNNSLTVTGANPSSLTGTLTVDEETVLNNSLSVTNSSPTLLSGTLTVDGIAVLNNEFHVANGSPSHLTGSLTVEGTTTLNNTLEVTNASPTTLTGTLNVDGETTLNNSLNVTNDSPTNLSGTLEVIGNTNLQGDLHNNGSTQIDQDLTVLGNTNIGGDITVQGESHTMGDVTVEGNTTINGQLNVPNAFPVNIADNLTVNGQTNLQGANMSGQVIIDADVNGPELTYASYPLRVRGSNQGIAIEIDGTASSSTNYMMFVDGNNTTKGGIEGQTLSELHNSFEYIWNVTMAGLDEAFVLAEGIACGFQLDAGEVGVMAAEGGAAYAIWVEMLVNYDENVGINFTSGGADYAEWLPKENQTELLFPGMVVGVKNGVISKNTNDADHFLAISTDPIVLGNMPEESEKSNYEKVAFLGQVPIRVVGKVEAGDYILPSGNNDGMAIAVSAKEIKTPQFAQIIGVAWEASTTDGVNMINTALGLNQNDLSNRVSDLESELNALKAEVAEIKAMLMGEETPELLANHHSAVSKNESTLQSSKTNNKIQGLTNEEMDEWLKKYGFVFDKVMAELKTFFDKQQVDYKQFPELVKMIDTPSIALKEMQEGTYMKTLWQVYEKRVTSISHRQEAASKMN